MNAITTGIADGKVTYKDALGQREVRPGGQRGPLCRP